MGNLYIAYGSNLNLAQMRTRCPSATIYSTGTLNNWELVYSGSPINSHATIRKCKGKSIPVLVWNIEESDELQLDIYEGYPNYYYKKYIMVQVNQKTRKGMAYIMNENKLPGVPSVNYVNTIQQGYMDNSFDLAILKESLKLNSVECKVQK